MHISQKNQHLSAVKSFSKLLQAICMKTVKEKRFLYFCKTKGFNGITAGLIFKYNKKYNKHLNSFSQQNLQNKGVLGDSTPEPPSPTHTSRRRQTLNVKPALSKTKKPIFCIYIAKQVKVLALNKYGRELWAMEFFTNISTANITKWLSIENALNHNNSMEISVDMRQVLIIDIF